MNYHPLRRLIVCAAIPAFVLSGCGPVSPLPPPLDEKDQRMIDGMWNNMLTPVNRLNRQTLIDAILVNWLAELGVDRMHLISEKDFSNGKVVMEIACDRAHPAADYFTVTVLNDRGKILRRERYSREELDKTAAALTDKDRFPSRIEPVNTTQSATQPSATQPATSEETPGYRQHRIEYERRTEAAQAATQPATLRN
jgi:hypothetical protein